MDTYCLLKQRFGFENYIRDVNIRTHRIILSKMRISNHRLAKYKFMYLLNSSGSTIKDVARHIKHAQHSFSQDISLRLILHIAK